MPPMIIYVHLLNDYSGSPRVLKTAIKALSDAKGGDYLIVAEGGVGHLNNVTSKTVTYWYKRSNLKVFTIINYIISQIHLFYLLIKMKNLESDAVIYVNTLLPFSAALFGRLTGRPVVYHLHEISLSPAFFRRFLVYVARYTAKSLIYVSSFHQKCLPMPGVPNHVVYNALDQKFFDHAMNNTYVHRHNKRFTVLMVASLRDYKGIPELMKLAFRFTHRTDIHFELLANESNTEIERYFSNSKYYANLTIHPHTSDPTSYYAEASLVVNLSRPDLWIETFGMTLLEAMSFGVPVIAPPVGGPVELVKDGQEGYLIDSRDTDKLTDVIIRLADDENLCMKLSAAARDKAVRFSPLAFEENLRSAFYCGLQKMSKV